MIELRWLTRIVEREGLFPSMKSTDIPGVYELIPEKVSHQEMVLQFRGIGADWQDVPHAMHDAAHDTSEKK